MLWQEEICNAPLSSSARHKEASAAFSCLQIVNFKNKPKIYYEYLALLTVNVIDDEKRFNVSTVVNFFFRLRILTRLKHDSSYRR